MFERRPSGIDKQKSKGQPSVDKKGSRREELSKAFYRIHGKPVDTDPGERARLSQTPETGGGQTGKSPDESRSDLSAFLPESWQTRPENTGMEKRRELEQKSVKRETTDSPRDPSQTASQDKTSDALDWVSRLPIDFRAFQHTCKTMVGMSNAEILKKFVLACENPNGK
jgi:hypothetical protein